MRRIYLDYASITPTDPRVRKEMLKYYVAAYGNPSSLHAEGVAAKKALGNARSICARFLNAQPDEIIFTGSGTEANNIAIIGLYNKMIANGKSPSSLHAIATGIEHPSVLECFEKLKELGVAVDYISVNERGIVNVEELRSKMRSETFLVSVMLVNNEIGTIMPIREVAKAIRHFNSHNPENSGAVLHCDASQAALYLDLDVIKLNVDMLTLDSHKVYGPKGVGMLYIKRGLEIAPVNFGGGQEKGMRPGTENIPGVCGLAKALEIAGAERDKETERLSQLRDKMIAALTTIEGVELNGDATERIANNINVSIKGVDNEFLVIELDAAGIACSTKSSCLRDEEESYVIAALGKESAKDAIRFTLGRFTRTADVAYAVKKVRELCGKARG